MSSYREVPPGTAADDVTVDATLDLTPPGPPREQPTLVPDPPQPKPSMWQRLIAWRRRQQS